VGGNVEVFDSFVAGDLIINGTMVNASLRTDDNKSYGPEGEEQTIEFTTATASATISIAGVAIALTATQTSVSAVATAVKTALEADTAFMASVSSVAVSAGVVTISFKSSAGNVDALSVSGTTNAVATAAVVTVASVGVSEADIAASAISKVAAINRVTEQSGAYALVNHTTVQGSSMTSPSEFVTAAVITVNGISTAAVALGTDNETNRAAIAKAINDVSAQSGVRAVNIGDDKQGILLIADDGRNVTLHMAGNLTSANTGLAAAGNYVGTYSLYSVAGEPITIEHQIGNDITGTGLRMGTYQPDMASMVSLERSGSGTADSGSITPLTAGVAPTNTAGVGVLNGDTLVINDIAIDAGRTTDDTASLSTTASAKAASAIAIAAAINKKTNLHGVTAKAEPNVIRSESVDSFATGTAGVINLNGVSISIAPTSRNAVMDTINAYSGQTGVVAKEFGQGIQLVAEDGRNIILGASTELSAANLGLAGVSIGAGSTGVVSAGQGNVFYSTVSLVSDQAFTLARGSEGGDNFSRLGFREGTFGGSNTGVKVAEVDVSTQDGAGIAITAIDAALEDVSTAQAKSGAYQNRLDAVINVQSEASENLTASKSRIMDTDYALEATNLAKAQIVAQAATAMLAQANQSQQTVLQLLQG
jgi:flagellin